MIGKSAHIRILEHLKPRQRQVLELIANSHTTKDIAATLRVSLKTAQGHRTNLMRATHLFTVAELTRLAIRLGLVE